MPHGLQLSARSVASLLAHIFGPASYDAPPYDRADLGRGDLLDLVTGPRPEPWRTVMLNPQPLPPRERYALTLADAHIQELLTLDRMATLLGDEVRGRALERSMRLVSEIDDLCPRWPRWPKRWPPPPPPWQHHEEMTVTELFVFGSRFLAASELMEQGELQEATIRLGEKALEQSQRG